MTAAMSYSNHNIEVKHKNPDGIQTLVLYDHLTQLVNVEMHNAQTIRIRTSAAKESEDKCNVPALQRNAQGMPKL
eukprot:758048-Amphidinium_carterae.1